MVCTRLANTRRLTTTQLNAGKPASRFFLRSRSDFSILLRYTCSTRDLLQCLHCACALTLMRMPTSAGGLHFSSFAVIAVRIFTFPIIGGLLYNGARPCASSFKLQSIYFNRDVCAVILSSSQSIIEWEELANCTGARRLSQDIYSAHYH